MKKTRYWIATTEGPVEITAISEETPGLPSVLCLTDTFQALPISKAYDEFVKAPTGIVEKLTGKSAFRTDLSAPISQGDSWHLGMCIGHICWSNTSKNFKTDHIWASGAVNPSLDVLPVTHIAEKWSASKELINQARLAGKKIDVFIHPQNANQIPNEDKDVAIIHPITNIQEAIDILSLQSEVGTSPSTKINPLLSISGSIFAAFFCLIFALILIFTPYGLVSSWNKLEKQGRFIEMGRSLDSAKHSEAFMDVISAYFFTSYLHKRAQKNESAVTIHINQKTDDASPKCLGGRVSVMDQNSLPDWMSAPCEYSIDLSNKSNEQVNIWFTIVSQSNYSETVPHERRVITLSKGEFFSTPFFKIKTTAEEFIHFIAVITDRPNSEPYRWFNNLSQNPQKQISFRKLLRSRGVGLKASKVLEP